MKISHIVNTIYSSRTYCLSGNGGVKIWLVDCGDIVPLMKLLHSISGDGFKIEGVLLTHAHYDHMYGLPRLREPFPEVKVYTNEAGREALGNERINMSRYHDDPINYVSDTIVVCSEGTEIELFEGMIAKVYETPGHNGSCLTYEVGEYLFTGDSYIPGIKVVTNLLGGNKEMALKSLERIKMLAEGKILCPGHVV